MFLLEDYMETKRLANPTSYQNVMTIFISAKIMLTLLNAKMSVKKGIPKLWKKIKLLDSLLILSLEKKI